MTKAPKTAAPNFSSFTKAELIKTIKTLHRQKTQLLNQIAKLEAQLTLDRQSPAMRGASSVEAADVDSRHPRVAVVDNGKVIVAQDQKPFTMANLEAEKRNEAAANKTLERKAIGEDVARTGHFPWETK